jgi:hypothetical protein
MYYLWIVHYLLTSKISNPVNQSINTRSDYAKTFDQRLLCAYNDQTVNFKDELKAEPSHIVFKSVVLLLKNRILLFRVKFDDLLH